MKLQWRYVLGLPIVFMLAVAVAAVFFIRDYITDNYDAIILELDEWIEQAVLPIKLAQLSAQDPVTSIPVPVSGLTVSQVEDTWGAPRGGGRTHQGTDFFAPIGTEIYAAAPGYVTRMNWNNLGGRSVWTVGPGGQRFYYTHLDGYPHDLSVGDAVTTNTVVGYVGKTGNARTTPPHLHFGIYTRSGAVNSYPLLTDRTYRSPASTSPQTPV